MDRGRESAGLLIGAVLALAVSAGTAPAADAELELPRELEGVALGESYDAVTLRLDLHRLVPLVNRQERRYQLAFAPVSPELIVVGPPPTVALDLRVTGCSLPGDAFRQHRRGA